jgi:hemerythrin superfamily protein
MDAIELLKKDHQEVTKLFQRYRGSRNARGRDVVHQLSNELLVHAQIEEDIFYPAVREAAPELAEKVERSLQEHERIKEELAALERQPEDVEETMATLEQGVEQHVTEEEGEIFPRAAEVFDERRRTELGRRLRARKGELTRESVRPTPPRMAKRRGGGEAERKARAGSAASSLRQRRTGVAARQGRSSGAAKGRKKRKAARGGRR